MSIFSIFRKEPQQPAYAPPPPAPKKMISETFRLDEQDRVIVEARTLLDYERVQPRVQDAHNIVARAKLTEARKSEDGSKLDNDARLGHVLTPDFSYHEDTGKFRLTGDRAIEGDRHKVTYKDWFESAVWDRQQKSVTLTYQEPATGGPQSGPPSRVKPSVEVVLREQQGSSPRALELLEAADLWRMQGLALDGRAGVDFHPDSGAMVAPKVPGELVQDTARMQTLVGKSQGYEKLKMHVEGENLQLNGFSPTGAPVHLGARRTAEGDYEVTFLQDRTHHYPSENSAERVIVSKETGALVYQTLEYNDPDNQYK